MMNDRDQKRSALHLSLANRWFPQMEVDVEPIRAVQAKIALLTDLDVFASIPDVFKGFRSVVFDCKTKNKQSAINRALWLRGVLDRLGANDGVCVLRKDLIELDHRLAANRLGIVLLAEEDFALYAKAITPPQMSAGDALLGNVDLWDKLYKLGEQFPRLLPAIAFIKSTYWMVDHCGEACRKTLGVLRTLHPEFDPARTEHVALFLDLCSLFARSLAVIASDVFKAYLRPSTQADLSEALLVMLYGGREAYQHRNELFKMVLKDTGDRRATELALPEWDRFVQLARQILDAPVEALRAPLILREAGFACLASAQPSAYLRSLCSESPQGARFSLLIADYMSKAARLPSEFGKASDSLLLPLMPIK